MDPHTQRAEAERWLGIAAKLLTARDFLGSKTFAIRAREADPNNAVSDQILAVVDTVLAGEKRVNSNQQPDWYQVLQLPRLVRDPDLIADHYRRLVLCLNPERNRFPFADYALQMVMDAWSVLSDPTKKWLFDNELALYLQQGEPVVTGAAAAAAVGGSGSGSAAAVAAGGGNSGGGSQLNTFQFFQPQPLPPQQPPQQQQQHPQQQQQHHQHHHQQQQQQQPMWQQPQQQQQQQQINQREFMPLPIQPQQQQQHPPHQQQQQQQHPPQQQQLPPQWQMRDPNPSKGVGGGGVERNKGVLNGIGIGARVATTASPMIPTQTTPRQIPPFRPPSPPLPAVSAVPLPGVSVPTAIPIVDGNAGTAPTSTNDINISINNNNNDISINGVATNAAAANNENNDECVVEDVDVDVDDNDDVVEDVESFWTACPYCFYIYEYPKVYQECTLRCQTCRKGFHAVQIPNPPPISPANNGGVGGGKNEKEKEKGKDNSFCCWGFFPLGFSMTAWKKQNQAGNLNGASNWVPFSPMFNCPVENGGGGFQWFDKNDGNANVGPTHAATKNTPRVYIDDDDILEVSEPSDFDSSDDDWRTYNQEKNKSKSKNKKKRRVRSGVQTRGRLRREGLNQVKQNVASGGGVSVGGEHLDDASDGQLVIGLAADKSDTGKTVNASLTRKQTRRSKKDVGRLDLNVEFNNDGEEHAPTVSAVNGEEDGIENIAFFEGLDEFLSTLPILNVAGDEKAKPS